MTTKVEPKTIPWSIFNQKNFRGQLLVWREDDWQFSGTISDITVKPGEGLSISLKEIEVRNKPDEPWTDSSCPVRSIHFNASSEPVQEAIGISIGHRGNLTGIITRARNRDELQNLLLQTS